tara:strand:+ start:200 stop:415 length:216 start_codon:yes stop_codon:yes gene_type:complete
MPRRTNHQLIWRTTKDGAEMILPKVITSDIGFQLMFGPSENHKEQQIKEKENTENYECRTYESLEDFVKFI